MHGLRISRYKQTKCCVKSVLRQLSKLEQHTKFCIDSNKRSCPVYLHDIIAKRYTVLYQITAIFWPKKKVWRFVGWTAGTSEMRRSKGYVSSVTGRAFTSIFYN